MSAAPVEVAVGVLVRPDGRFLIAQRPAGKPMPGYWEFPGGKLEAGESVRAALVREFQEELAIEITDAVPWFIRHHVYAHATVRLHFWRAFAWRGSAQPLENQVVRWEDIAQPLVEPWLPGALPLKRWLALPDWYAISHAQALGEARFLARLDAALARRALRLVQLREPGLDAPAVTRLAREMRARCREHGARLVVSSRHEPLLWELADGVHCTARDLAALDARPAVEWCAASCHDAAGIARAAALGFDFAVAGPVAPTASHPEAQPLGWDGFVAATRDCELPVYALGGLQRGDAGEALRAGAQGIAAQRASWADEGPIA